MVVWPSVFLEIWDAKAKKQLVSKKRLAKKTLRDPFESSRKQLWACFGVRGPARQLLFVTPLRPMCPSHLEVPTHLESRSDFLANTPFETNRGFCALPPKAAGPNKSLVSGKCVVCLPCYPRPPKNHLAKKQLQDPSEPHV